MKLKQDVVAHFGLDSDVSPVRVNTPVGERCMDCDRRIVAGDEGVVIKISTFDVTLWRYQHLCHRRDWGHGRPGPQPR